ncbi:WGxxGxxG family protein [Salinithrix halophila]|uniref:WGxxGxxG family protein n=1 Tax=Salinithrix halophila TaxID=1485204 RepID=A0ABV8JCS3_9BACL
MLKKTILLIALALTFSLGTQAVIIDTHVNAAPVGENNNVTTRRTDINRNMRGTTNINRTTDYGDYRRVATPADNGNDFNWGWLGVLGLLGLAGRRRREA